MNSPYNVLFKEITKRPHGTNGHEALLITSPFFSSENATKNLLFTLWLFNHIMKNNTLSYKTNTANQFLFFVVHKYSDMILWKLSFIKNTNLDFCRWTISSPTTLMIKVRAFPTNPPPIKFSNSKSMSSYLIFRSSK